MKIVMSKNQKTSLGKKEYFILGQINIYKLYLNEVFLLYCLQNILPVCPN